MTAEVTVSVMNAGELGSDGDGDGGGDGDGDGDGDSHDSDDGDGGGGGDGDGDGGSNDDGDGAGDGGFTESLARSTGGTESQTGCPPAARPSVRLPDPISGAEKSHSDRYHRVW